jgi:hypothetical protein
MLALGLTCLLLAAASKSRNREDSVAETAAKEASQDVELEKRLRRIKTIPDLLAKVTAEGVPQDVVLVAAQKDDAKRALIDAAIKHRMSRRTQLNVVVRKKPRSFVACDYLRRHVDKQQLLTVCVALNLDVNLDMSKKDLCAKLSDERQDLMRAERFDTLLVCLAYASVGTQMIIKAILGTYLHGGLPVVWELAEWLLRPTGIRIGQSQLVYAKQRKEARRLLSVDPRTISEEKWEKRKREVEEVMHSIDPEKQAQLIKEYNDEDVRSAWKLRIKGLVCEQRTRATCTSTRTKAGTKCKFTNNKCRPL